MGPETSHNSKMCIDTHQSTRQSMVPWKRKWQHTRLMRLLDPGLGRIRKACHPRTPLLPNDSARPTETMLAASDAMVATTTRLWRPAPMALKQTRAQMLLPGTCFGH